MKTKSGIVSALILAVGIIILGFTLKAGIDNYISRSRSVTVRGLSERQVAANKVTWPIVTKEVGNDLSAIYTHIQATNGIIRDYLTSNGISESEISVNAPTVYDTQAERYSSNDNQYRYVVTNVVVVTSEQIDKVGELIRQQTELMQRGVAIVAGDYEYSTEYEYTDLNAIKPDMIAEATAAAREAAARFASDSGSSVGKIITASQGQFSITDRDRYTPNIKTVRVVTYITYSLDD